MAKPKKPTPIKKPNSKPAPKTPKSGDKFGGGRSPGGQGRGRPDQPGFPGK